ncbi:MAG: hypothetical protein A2107_00740 [Verrucomicrobia bacterium GWF2_62_7]|nr:MAG: hypothetical protein A2107_00740 [Verrucomicrobia bacterium GWF2_62_7]
MNRCRIISALLFVLVCAGAVAQESYLWSFDRDPVGSVPSYLLAESNWVVMVDSGAPTQPNVLSATAAGCTNALGSLCVVQGFKLELGRLWTRVNVFSGAAGLVFRMRAADNFNVLMVTPDGSRLQLMAVRNGVPQELASSVLKTTFGRWHRMGVELDGRTIGCYFDGELRMTAAEDPMSVGKCAIGLIVAGGGRAHFDDLNVDVITAAEPARRGETVVQILLAGDRISIGDTVVTLKELVDRLTQRFDSAQRLLLVVDRNMDYERVEQVMKAAVTIGFEKISIEMRK